MSILPLCVATTLIVVPALLHRWEHGRITTNLPPAQWVKGASSIILSLILAFVAALFLLSVGRGHWTSLAPLAVILVLLFPWPITRRVLIPLGAWRAAYALAQLAGFVWRGDVGGGQLVAGAWALRSRPSLCSERSLGWLQQQAENLPLLEPASVVAHALIRECRGDTDGARKLMEAVGDFGDDCPPVARQIAREWLLDDAISRSDWDRAEVLGRAPGRRSTRARFLGAVAARHLGHPPIPSNFELVVRWLSNPRLRTLGLLRRTLSLPHLLDQTPTTHLPELGADCSAVGLHIQAVLAEPKTEELLALGRAWDQTLHDTELRAQTARRAIALRAGDPDRAWNRFADQVEADLGLMARGCMAPLQSLEASSTSLRRVAGRLRHELLDELAIDTEQLADRVDQSRSLPPLGEMQEWLNVRDRYEKVWAMGGVELRRIAYCQLHDSVCGQAVWLWNDRGEAPLANAMFRWLLDEAIIVGDELAIELQRRNLACAR